MANYTATIDVDADPAVAFAYLGDPQNRREWDPSIRSIAAANGGTGRVGDRYDVTVGFYGRAIDAVYEIDELDAPDRIVFVTSGRVRGRDVITIEPLDGGSRVTLDLEVQLRGMAKLLDRGLQVAFAGIGENAAAAMKRALDELD